MLHKGIENSMADPHALYDQFNPTCEGLSHTRNIRSYQWHKGGGDMLFSFSVEGFIRLQAFVPLPINFKPNLANNENFSPFGSFTNEPRGVRDEASYINNYVMQPQALCVFHSPLTLAVSFLKCF